MRSAAHIRYQKSTKFSSCQHIRLLCHHGCDAGSLFGIWFVLFERRDPSLGTEPVEVTEIILSYWQQNPN